MRNEVLSDRLINYADALVAATFLIMSGIGAGVGDPDIRCELADAAPKMLAIVSVGGVVIFLALRWLTRWSEKLRDLSVETPDTLLVQKRLSLVRHVLVIVFVVQSVVFVVLSISDSGCP